MKFDTYEYTNGFRMIYEKPKNHLPLTSIICFVKFGSIYESEKSKGIAHFIEHMCFKGTRNLTTKQEIMKTYNNIGAYFNAFTTKEYTYYVIKCNEPYVSKCIHVLSDILMNSVFKKNHCELEKQVVIEEMIRQEDNHNFHISKMKDKYLYSGSQYDRPIDDLLFHQSTDYNSSLQIYEEFYKPSNMGLSVVSNIPFHTIKKIVSSSFFMKISKPLIVYPSYQLDVQSKIEYNIQQKQGVNATHLSISFRTCSYRDNDKYIISLLSHIIGGSMSSRMFSLLREKYGLTYGSSCYYTYYAHMGEITLQTMSNPHNIMKNKTSPGILPLMIKIMNDLIKNGITQQELSAVKGFLQGKTTMKMENSDSQCEYNGLEYFIYGNGNKDDFVSYDQIYKKYYSTITKKQVNDIIEKYFKSETMVVCLFGEHVPSIDSVKKQCNLFIG